MASINSDLEDLIRQRTRVLVEKAMELKQANRRLMELDELKSAFLSSVSHELRTPLTSLLGFSKIIKRDFLRCFMPLAEEEAQRRLGERIQSNLDIIGNEGERLTRLINDVLDLSRIESGKESWRFTEVDLAGAINAAVDASSGCSRPSPRSGWSSAASTWSPWSTPIRTGCSRCSSTCSAMPASSPRWARSPWTSTGTTRTGCTSAWRTPAAASLRSSWKTFSTSSTRSSRATP